ncbi:ABC transporter substrate-binding protein, partial [Sinorhizobium meliloti]
MKRSVRSGRFLLCATAMLYVLGTGTRAEEPFDIDALVEAARKEKPITVYDSTGKIVEMAKNFADRYDVGAEGSKVKASAQLEMIIREARANNI